MNTAEPAPGKADAPTIEIAAHAGTCYGVQRALDMEMCIRDRDYAIVAVILFVIDYLLTRASRRVR